MESILIPHDCYQFYMYRIITGIPERDSYVIRVFEKIDLSRKYGSKAKINDIVYGEVGHERPATARNAIEEFFPEFPGFTSQPAYRDVSLSKVDKFVESYMIFACLLHGVNYSLDL